MRAKEPKSGILQSWHVFRLNWLSNSILMTKICVRICVCVRVKCIYNSKPSSSFLPGSAVQIWNIFLCNRRIYIVINYYFKVNYNWEMKFSNCFLLVDSTPHLCHIQVSVRGKSSLSKSKEKVKSSLGWSVGIIN